MQQASQKHSQISTELHRTTSHRILTFNHPHYLHCTYYYLKVSESTDYEMWGQMHMISMSLLVGSYKYTSF
jgi:hypothetical protein